MPSPPPCAQTGMATLPPRAGWVLQPPNLENGHPSPTDGGGKLSASQEAALRVPYIPLPQSQDPKHLGCNTRPAGLRRGEAGRADTSFYEEDSHEVIVPGPSEAEECMGASPSRVWAGRAWDLWEGAGGSATSQLRFPKHFQPCCTMQNPLFRSCGKRNHRPSAGGNIPVESGRGSTSTWHPASYGSIPAPILAMPRTSGGVQGTIPPLPGRGIGTHSVATPALSLQESDVPGPGQAGHGRGSLRLGAGAVLPRRTLGRQDKRIFSAANSPSVSFPCPAPLGASGAAARPRAASISYPLNPCGAGVEWQESQFILVGKLKCLSTGEDATALVIADGSITARTGSPNLLLTPGHKRQLSNLLLHNFYSWPCALQPRFPKA